MSIHHNTLAKAKKLGFSIKESPDTNGYIVTRSDTLHKYVWGVGSNPKECLAQAIEDHNLWLVTQSAKVIVMADHYRAKYRATGYDYCGDVVSQKLAEHLTDKDNDKYSILDAVAIVNGIDMSKYSKLNNGMQRMNLGNRLRGLLRKGEDVIIGDVTIKAEDFDIDS